jgi:uncharacterized membrane protein YhaH (DUF805 family)
MSFGEAISTCFHKYADFSGRARRSEYWYWALFAFIVGVVADIVDVSVGSYPAIVVLVDLALLLPSLAVGVRRLHDTGRSGWWLLLLLIPFVGAIVLIVFYVQDTQPTANQWGPPAKHVTGYGGQYGQPGGGYGTPPPPPPPPPGV